MLRLYPLRLGLWLTVVQGPPLHNRRGKGTIVIPISH